MSTKELEDSRWRNNDQQIVFRHEKALDMISGGNALDLGCGDGLFLQALRYKGIEGCGLDFSVDGIKKCKEKGIKARVYDFSDKPLPFDDNTFDYVVMLDILEHLYYPEKVLKEACRVSKKYIIISVPNFNSLPSRIQMFLGKVPENNRPNKGHIFWFNFNNLRQMLMSTKLAIIELKTNTFWNNKALIGKFMKIMSRVMPSLFALSFVVKTRKQ